MIHPTDLLENASLFGVEAVERFLVRDDEDWRFTALLAATSLEQLVKAALAERNLLLLADNENAMTALLGAKSDRLTTIGASKAVGRYAKLNHRFGQLAKGLGHLLEVRNGIVHLAAEPPNTFPRSMDTYLRAVEVVLEDLAEDEESFWVSDRLSAVVANRRLERARSLEEEVSRTITMAMARFETKYRGLSELERRAAVAAAERSPSRVLSDVEFGIECPACESRGSLVGGLDVEWEVDELDWIGSLTLWPSHFTCRVCDLDLDGQEEVEIGVGDVDLPDDIRAEDYFDPPDIDDIPGYSPEDVHPYPRGR